MTENMKKLLEAMSQNAELAKKISELDKDGLIAAAKELGIDLTEADFVQPEGELNADELEAVAGGKACYCVVGGGGTESGVDDTCACAVGGAGFFYGVDRGIDGYWSRCFCFAGGYGHSKN